MDRDDGGVVDWNAAFEAIVAPLRPSRSRRLARAGGQVVLSVLVVSVAWWMLAHLVAAQVRCLDLPWR